jgi:hypothetical protein
MAEEKASLDLEGRQDLGDVQRATQVGAGATPKPEELRDRLVRGARLAAAVARTQGRPMR